MNNKSEIENPNSEILPMFDSKLTIIIPIQTDA